MLRRLFNDGECPSCAAKRAASRDEARALYQSVLDDLKVAKAEAIAYLPHLSPVAAAADLSESERERLHDAAFRGYAETALADDVLTEREEANLLTIAQALGITQDVLGSRFREVLQRLIIARVNDGRMPVLSAARLLARKNEIVHGEVQAQMLKRVSVREYRGGYSGVSFRIAKGVRYHFGGVRGRSVVVGTRLDAADAGILSVTSLRIAFTGGLGAVEMPYGKLLGINVFSDAVQFQVSNRKTAPVFRVESGEVFAALVNGAYQTFVS